MFPPQEKEAGCTQLHTHAPLLFNIDLPLLTHRCRRDNDFNDSNSTRACPAVVWGGRWVLTQFSRLPLHFNERAFWNDDRFKVLKSHPRIIAAATMSSYSHSLSFPLVVSDEPTWDSEKAIWYSGCKWLFYDEVTTVLYSVFITTLWLK